MERIRLYDLEADVVEREDLSADCPEVGEQLLAILQAARAELGDDATDTVGSDVRPVGRVAEPATLTTYDPNTPYFMAEYDLAERG